MNPSFGLLLLAVVCLFVKTTYATNDRSLQLASEQQLAVDVSNAGLGSADSTNNESEGGVFIKILDENDRELFNGAPVEVQNADEASQHERELQDDCGMELTAKCYWYDRYPDVKCHDFIPECNNNPNLSLQITYIYKFKNAANSDITITGVNTDSRKSQSHMDRFEDQWWFPRFKPGQASVVGENFESFNVCGNGALDATITLTATMNGRQCRAQATYKVMEARAEAERTRTPAPTPAPTKKPSTDPTLRPTNFPTTSPTPRPNPMLEMSRTFTKKRQKNKSCEWLAAKAPATVKKICRTRVLEPKAKDACPWTCNQRCNPNDPASSPHQACTYESINRFLHRRPSFKTCQWLSLEPEADRNKLCRFKAKKTCPAVCGGFSQ